MKKIIAFAGSNSSTSINHKLILSVSEKINNKVEVIKLTTYPLPMFGEDIERKDGYSETLKNLLSIINKADALLISVNEHNGTVSAFFKNVLDWLSRIEYKFLEKKNVFLMSTSNGRRGALSSQEYTAGVLPRFGAGEITRFTLPSFSENFKEGKITNTELNSELELKLSQFEASL
ncbi:NAD(P)H-dependent oxidoreductase [Aureisphaera sp. CAU 1614]|uniref:NAD(P)H-dependent oxidoreductase n=1 Tax=Halomarinibacterium sedimenti TaxID=2857106 RepID=A0A9X1FNF0_9FLAO|nr:NADPH-dependent FMN reductase [Halomarinibacterium sedimenti]MBW2937795.1 NAD(P)H-dependent oxidoreductase [Halomarinibacterium sedimenti]